MDVTWNVLATDWCCFAFIKEMESSFDVLKFFLKWPHTIRYFHFACLVLGLQQFIKALYFMRTLPISILHLFDDASFPFDDTVGPPRESWLV